MLDRIYRALILSSCLTIASCGGSAILPPLEVETTEPGTNLALGKNVSQSSIAFNGDPERAIDGNTDGTFSNQSVTHTNSELEPWWEVDLRTVQEISNITIYNRTDTCCNFRLSDFYILVSDNPFESDVLQESIDQNDVNNYYYGPGINGSHDFDIKATGQYIRIQKVGEGSALNLAEVEVIAGSINEEIETPVVKSENVPSPLSRLSNDEFVKSLRDVLNLTDNSPYIEAAIPLMVAESSFQGLTNDANIQTFSTTAINGFMTVSVAAANDFVGDISTLEELEDKMQCDGLQQQFGRSDYSHLICTRDFFRSFVERIYGSVYSDDSEFFDTLIEDIETYVASAELSTESVETTKFRLQIMFSYMFLVPEFLVFLEEETTTESSTLSSTEIAKRLSYFLTGTLPDELLRTDALNDTLTDPDIRLEHAMRLLEDPAVNEQFASFFVGWLGVSIENDGVEQEDLDALQAWLSNWFSNSQPFGNLYSTSANSLTINGTEETMDAGVLGFKAFVASMTNDPVPNFINRGDFIVRTLLCGDLPEDIPVSAFADSSVVSDTPEDLFHELKTYACASCHKIADNYGALFQQFTSEDSLFDSTLSLYGDSFELFPIGDFEGEYSDLTSFGQALGNSQTAAECASKLLYRHSVRRSLDPSGNDNEALEAMYTDWVNTGDTSIKSLIRSIVTSDHFVTRYN